MRFAHLSPWIGLAFLIMAGPAGAAEEFLAPSQILTQTGNNLAIVRVLAVTAPDTVLWHRVEVIRGRLSEEFSAHVPEQLARELTGGQEHLIAVTSVRRNPLFREGLEKDPTGTRVIELPSVGPAVFPVDASLLRLIEARLADDDEMVVASAVELLGAGDERLVAVGAMELSARSGSAYGSNPAVIGAVREVLEARSTSLEVQTVLLALTPRVDAGGRPNPWLTAWVRRTLADRDPDVELGSFEPRLLEESLAVLAAVGEPEDTAVSNEFLSCNHPGVVKAAIRVAESLDCMSGLAAASSLLADGSIHDGSMHRESRQALESFTNAGCP